VFGMLSCWRALSSVVCGMKELDYLEAEALCFGVRNT